MFSNTSVFHLDSLFTQPQYRLLGGNTKTALEPTHQEVQHLDGGR